MSSEKYYDCLSIIFYILRKFLELKTEITFLYKNYIKNYSCARYYVSKLNHKEKKSHTSDINFKIRH